MILKAKGYDIVIKIALCDDQQAESDNLEKLILKYCSSNKAVCVINKFSAGLDLLSCDSKFDVIFLDILLQDINGIELAHKIREKDKHTKIIFITSFSNYQTDAFTVRAFGYIVKPYSYKTICNQLNDVFEYSKQETGETCYTFNTDIGFKTILLSDIYYFEAWSHKTRLVEQDAYVNIDESVNNIYQTLKLQGFAMPHKSFVVNMQRISSIKGYDVYLTNKAIIPISQKRAVQFKTEFHTYLKSNFNLFTLSR